MARYVIGDVQGCFDQLLTLLQAINFRSDCDQLWFCGDLVARGPKSLETLRFIKALGPNALTVLGNHDLNFLASLWGYGKISASDQLGQLQQAGDKHLLADWLLQHPLLHYDAAEDLLLVHAGLSAQWDLPTAVEASAEVAAELQQNPQLLFSKMYGNDPAFWADATTATEKLRFTINSLTRMRYCYRDGKMDFKEKAGISTNPELVPWFDFWRHRSHPQIFFGHWAALMGKCDVSTIHALDTGCVCGNYSYKN